MNTMTKEEIKSSPTGLRFNTGKPRWGLVHYKSLEPMVRVLEHGAAKYDDNNWMKGLVPREILECMQRHLAAIMDGETHDKESGLPHIGHVLCNAMFYSYFTEVHPEKAREKDNQREEWKITPPPDFSDSPGKYGSHLNQRL